MAVAMLGMRVLAAAVLLAVGADAASLPVTQSLGACPVSSSSTQALVLYFVLTCLQPSPPPIMPLA